MTLKLNLNAGTTPVVLDKNGTLMEYELREMTAAARDQYLDEVASRMQLGADGKPISIKKFEGMQSALVHRCLFGKDGKPVSDAIIQTWPASAVSALFVEAQRLNALDRKPEEAIADAKNV